MLSECGSESNYLGYRANRRILEGWRKLAGDCKRIREMRIRSRRKFLNGPWKNQVALSTENGK